MPLMHTVQQHLDSQGSLGSLGSIVNRALLSQRFCQEQHLNGVPCTLHVESRADRELRPLGYGNGKWLMVGRRQ